MWVLLVMTVLVILAMIFFILNYKKGKKVYFWIGFTLLILAYGLGIAGHFYQWF